MVFVVWPNLTRVLVKTEKSSPVSTYIYFRIHGRMEIGDDLALVSTLLLLTEFDQYKSSEYAEGDGGGRLHANRHVVVPCPQAAEAPHRGRRWTWPAMRKPSDCQDPAKRVGGML